MKKKEKEKKHKKEKKEIEIETIDWYWLESSLPDIHFRKNNNKAIYQPRDENFAKTKGTLIIDSREIYYTLLFE